MPSPQFLTLPTLDFEIPGDGIEFATATGFVNLYFAPKAGRVVRVGRIGSDGKPEPLLTLTLDDDATLHQVKVPRGSKIRVAVDHAKGGVRLSAEDAGTELIGPRLDDIARRLNRIEQQLRVR